MTVPPGAADEEDDDDAGDDTSDDGSDGYGRAVGGAEETGGGREGTAWPGTQKMTKGIEEGPRRIEEASAPVFHHAFNE